MRNLKKVDHRLNKTEFVGVSVFWQMFVCRKEVCNQLFEAAKGPNLTADELVAMRRRIFARQTLKIEANGIVEGGGAIGIPKIQGFRFHESLFQKLENDHDEEIGGQDSTNQSSKLRRSSSQGKYDTEKKDKQSKEQLKAKGFNTTSQIANCKIEMQHVKGEKDKKSLERKNQRSFEGWEGKERIEGEDEEDATENDQDEEEEEEEEEEIEGEEEEDDAAEDEEEEKAAEDEEEEEESERLNEAEAAECEEEEEAAECEEEEEASEEEEEEIERD